MTQTTYSVKGDRMTDAGDNLDKTSDGHRAGRSKPGRSATRKGYEQSTRWRTSKLLDAIGGANAQSIVNAMVVKALGGDTSAAEVVLKRCWPVRTGRPLKIALPSTIANLADVGTALDVITSGVAAGELSAEEAAHLCAVVEHRRKLVELLDLEARIAALEATAGTTP
jgi:hypothetical protein